MPIRLNGSTSGFTELSAPPVAGSNTLVLPTGNGSNGQVLTTNGSGVLSFATNGKLIQTVSDATNAVATGTTTIPLDDTIPQITEGNEYITRAITPTSASNLLCIQATIHLSSTAGVSNLTAALFQDSTANALAVVTRYMTNGNLNTLNLTHWMTAGTTSATTFRIRAGSSAAGTTTSNGVSGARLFGGACISNLLIMEVTP
tara:strand:- start:2883 stop:3488 length:606 start_codon:yes stop_codon:yes gene_type:complete